MDEILKDIKGRMVLGQEEISAIKIENWGNPEKTPTPSNRDTNLASTRFQLVTTVVPVLTNLSRQLSS